MRFHGHSCALDTTAAPEQARCVLQQGTEEWDAGALWLRTSTYSPSCVGVVALLRPECDSVEVAGAFSDVAHSWTDENIAK